MLEDMLSSILKRFEKKFIVEVDGFKHASKWADPKEKVPCDCPKGGRVGERETVCEKCGGSEWITPAPQSEKWEEEFTRKFVYYNDGAKEYIDCTSEELKSFISRLLDTARREEREKMEEGKEGLNRVSGETGFDLGFKAGEEAERNRILGLAEEMGKELLYEAGYLEEGDDGSERKGVNRAIMKARDLFYALKSKIKE